mgnify:CR=1 FL=1
MLFTLISLLLYRSLAPLTIALSLYVAVSALRLWIGSRRISLESTEQTVEGVLGSELWTSVCLANSSSIPLAVISMRALADREGLEVRCPETSLNPKEERSLRIYAKSRHPGVFAVKGFELVLSTPERLFTHRVFVRSDMKFVFYPETYLLVARLLGLELLGEGRTGPSASLIVEKYYRKVRAGLEYYGSREAQPGDQLKYIDWKATARSQKLIVKEYLGEMGAGVLLLLDLSSSNIPILTLDAICSTALLILNTCRQLKIPAGLGIWRGGEMRDITRLSASDEHFYSLYLKVLDIFNAGHGPSRDDLEVMRPFPRRLSWRAKLLELAEKAKEDVLKGAASSERALRETLLVLITDLRTPVEPLGVLKTISPSVRVMVQVPEPFWREVADRGLREVARAAFDLKVSFLKAYNIPVIVATPEELARKIPIVVR